MPVPKRKRSHARKHKRNANKGVKVKAFTSCTNCKEILMPHVACSNCGFYKGAKVLKTKQERSMRRSADRKNKESRTASQNAAIDTAAEKSE